MAAITLTHAPTRTITIIPTANLLKRRFVAMNGLGYCGANAKARGVTDDVCDLTAGVPGACFTKGTVFVEAGGDIAIGDPIVSTSVGKAIKGTAATATPASGATPVESTGAQPAIPVAGGYLPQAINGYAVTAGADGDFVLVELS